jgi:hypothetical protein
MEIFVGVYMVTCIIGLIAINLYALFCFLTNRI